MKPPNDRRPPGVWPHACRREPPTADITPPHTVGRRRARVGGVARLADQEPGRRPRPAAGAPRPDSGSGAEPSAAPADAGGSSEAPAEQAGGADARLENGDVRQTPRRRAVFLGWFVAPHRLRLLRLRPLCLRQLRDLARTLELLRLLARQARRPLGHEAR